MCGNGVFWVNFPSTCAYSQSVDMSKRRLSACTSSRRIKGGFCSEWPIALWIPNLFGMHHHRPGIYQINSNESNCYITWIGVLFTNYIHLNWLFSWHCCRPCWAKSWTLFMILWRSNRIFLIAFPKIHKISMMIFDILTQHWIPAYLTIAMLGKAFTVAFTDKNLFSILYSFR